MALIRKFGRVSGLHIQPTKSWFRFLNTVVSALEWHDIPVFQQRRTQKYLGYEVGFADQNRVNWANRIRIIQRRMITAETAPKTVHDRVDLFNTVALPSIPFTAKMFGPSPEVLRQLVNIQKNFIWKKRMEDDPGRHKMSPKWIFQPQEAG
ncbi:RxLR effector protein [Phytophthora megakarya]|uniref:RxLR effector protein n=1 Tax=Phytophthora megakarya TaxID=4795 RepID=A0A225VYH1_9STRA|nr:RxLR effector protein [Phytophthora megakarya]